MTESTATSLCPTCNGEMLSKDGQEFCPACLLQQGMQDSTFGGNPALQNWTPPPLEELVSRFPNLDIESLLGQGGMGAVYKVRQKELDRPAALKILPEAVASDPSFTERFLREARLLASLSHPHIVTVYEFGERDGLYFILMEYVDGVTLRQASLADPIKRLAPAEALEVVGQLCEALQFAHDEGVVHRDIKPENILIDKRGRVKIADFGLARLLGKPADLPTLTRTHQLMGTPTYMAPEQIEGQPVIDHRADIYSLGVVFYELLTGELPLGRFQPPSEKVQLDARLDEVVFRTLEKEPNRRYQHASDVRTDMNAINAARVTAAADASRFNGSNLASRSMRLLIVCWALIGTTLLFFVWGLGDPTERWWIGVAVAALTGALLQVHRSAPDRWKWPRLATGFVLGVVLPTVLLLGTFNKLRDRMAYEKQMADVQAQRLEARALDLDRQLRDAKQQLSEGGGMEMGGGMGMGDMGMSMGGGMGGYAAEMGGMEMGGGGYGSEMGMSGMGGGMMSEGNYDSSGDMGMGMDYGGFGMGMGGPPRPAILIEGTEVGLSPTVRGFTDEQRIMVSEILTDIHQKYLQLESDYSKITVGKDDSVTTTIYLFYNEWERLENELWTRLDDAVDVKQQRTLRQKLKPEYLRDAEHSMPGLLGWRPSVSSSAKPGEFAPIDATVRLRRVGKWVEAEIAGDPGNKSPRVIPSSPELPVELQRFDHENTPNLAIHNVRSAYGREDWKTLLEQFTPLARFDVWAGLYTSANTENPDFKRATLHVFDTELNHPSMTAVVPNSQIADVREHLRSTAIKTASALNGNLLIRPNHAERVAHIRSQVQQFDKRITEYLLLHVILLNQALGKPALPIFEGEDAELKIEVQEGNSATGELRIGDASMIPMSFRLVDNNWKIDGILTPVTSALMHDPEPTPTGEADQTNDDETPAAEPADEPESNQP